VWQHVLRAVVAAHNGDWAAVEQETISWPHEFGLGWHQRAGLYVHALMNYRVQEIYRGRPTAVDLQILAIQIQPRFRRVWPRAGREQIEETLRRTFSMRQLKFAISPAEYLLFGIAILGAILHDPVSQLDQMRPHVADWWLRNRDHFPEQAR
jgi:hypothetical protein